MQGPPACWNPHLPLPSIFPEHTTRPGSLVRVKGEDETGGHQGRGGRAAPFFPTVETHSLVGPRIVEEVRSIRFNKEQEQQLLERHLSMSLSMESWYSMDIRGVTCQQDLITALVNKEKVQFPSPTQTVLTPPPSPVQPSPASSSLCHSSQGSVYSKTWTAPLDSHAVTANLQIRLGSTFPAPRGPVPPVAPRPLSPFRL